MSALTDSLQEISKQSEENLTQATKNVETFTKELENAEYTLGLTQKGTDAYYRAENNVDEKRKKLEEAVRVHDECLRDMAVSEKAFKVQSRGNTEEMNAFIASTAVVTDETGKKIIKTEREAYDERSGMAQAYREAASRAQDEDTQKTLLEMANSEDEKTQLIAKSLVGQISLIDANGETFQLSYEELMNRAKDGVTNGGVGVDLAMQENMSSIVAAISNSQLPVEEQTKMLADIQTQVFQNNVPNVSAAEQSTMQSVLDAISSTNPQMASAVQALVNAGILEMDNGKIGFSDKAREMGLDGNETLQGYVKEFETTAKSIAEGATSGVKSGAWNFVLQVGEMAGNAAAEFAKRLNINSPSRVFRDIAKSIPEGAALGVKGNAKIATDAISAMAKDMTSEYENSLDNFTTAGIQDVFDKLPEQEIKLVGLLEKIKGLDATALMDQARAAVYSNQTAVAGAAARSNYMINTGISQSTSSGGDRQTVINFNQPVESPDATARAINRIFTFGLAGDKG